MKQNIYKILSAASASLALAVFVLGSPAQAATSYLQTRYYSKVGATSIAVSKPSATAGDVLVAELTLNQHSSAGVTAPSGWTEACRYGTTSGNALTKAVYTHAITSSEPTEYRWYFPSSGAALAIMAYRGVATTNPIEKCVGQLGYNTSSITAPATTASYSGEFMIASFARTGNGSISQASGTTAEAYDNSTVADSRAVNESADYYTVSAGNVAAKSATGSAWSSVVIGMQYGLVPSGMTVSPPANTSLPIVSGTTTQGQTLSTTNGTWSGSPTGYSYAWQRCDSAGASCALISGATSTTYVLTSTDVGKTLRSRVTATNAGGSTTATSNATAVIAGLPTGSAYNQTILADSPVGFWNIAGSGTTDNDLTTNGRNGTYYNGTPSQVAMPNGEMSANFNGTNQYLKINSNAAFSIPTTKKLTVEAWIRPAVSDFPVSTDGYVNWLGKCDQYSPTCEWQTRMYNASHARCSRISAYAFNNSAGLGSGAYWQQVCGSGTIQPNKWYHIVAEYQTLTTPSACNSSYPGTIDIWVNGIYWNQSTHGDTGCMSQYSIRPTASTSPLTVGTMAYDNWFKGAIGKVAIYNYLLSGTQITNHYKTMTGLTPTGSCGSTCSF